MVIRRIQGLYRSSSGYVTGVCNPADPWASRTVGDVVADIMSGTHQYVVERDNVLARVYVVADPDGRYLRTGPDRTPENNLDALPACDSLRTALPTPMRRNIATVPTAERRRLRDAILALNQRFYETEHVRDLVSIWFKQDQIHQATHVHTQPSFLPWHRVLVNEFERQLQEIDPTLALHYWDWTTDPRRSPNGRGGTTDLMTPAFMGSPSGDVGAPFESFSSAAPPNRTTPQYWPAFPPRTLARALPTSGRSPTEVELSDVDLTLFPPNDQPSSADDVRVQGDQFIVESALAGPRRDQFDRFRNALTPSHGRAHNYLGGNLGPQGTSFEDPFVFLLHSNVDRLWASWQLSPVDTSGGRGWAASPWRLEGASSYGRLADGEQSDGSVSDIVRSELNDAFQPWNGRAGSGAVWLGTGFGKRQDGENGIFPWNRSSMRRDITARDPEVLRPPLYDVYLNQDRGLLACWSTLRLGSFLHNHDVIQLTVERMAVHPEEVEFRLQTGPDVWWWKGLRILEGGPMIETEGSRTTDQVRVPVAGLWAGDYLLLHKFVGTQGKRIVYLLGDLGWIPSGSRLTFAWLDD